MVATPIVLFRNFRLFCTWGPSSHCLSVCLCIERQILIVSQSSVVSSHIAAMNCPLRQIWFESFSQKLFLWLYFALHTTNERTNRRTNEETNEQTNEWTTNRQMNERTDEWTKDIFTHERQCSKNVSLFVKLWPWWKFALHNFFFCNVKIKRGFENFFVGEKFKLFKSTKSGSFSSFFF